MFHRYYISKGAVIDQLGGDLNSTPLHWAIRYVSDIYSNKFAMTLHCGTCPSQCNELHLCDLEEVTSAFIHPLKSPKHSRLKPVQKWLWKKGLLAAFACKWHLTVFYICWCCSSSPLNRQGHLSMVIQLMRYGADQSLADGEGYRSLHLAVLFQHMPIAAYLMAKGEVWHKHKVTF